MLEDALLDNFTNSINPIAIQTMQMLVGDESLQFRFVNSKTNPVGVGAQHNLRRHDKAAYSRRRDYPTPDYRHKFVEFLPRRKRIQVLGYAAVHERTA